MVAVDVVLCHFHRFQLFEAGFLGDFILAAVGVMLEVADIRDDTSPRAARAGGRIVLSYARAYCRYTMGVP